MQRRSVYKPKPTFGYPKSKVADTGLKSEPGQCKRGVERLHRIDDRVRELLQSAWLREVFIGFESSVGQ